MKKMISIFVFISFSTLFGYSQSLITKTRQSAEKLTENFQEIDGAFLKTETGVAVQRVISSDGDKNKLYDKVLEFLAITYIDSKEVVQVKDKDSGLIIGKGMFSFFVTDTDSGHGVKHNIQQIIKAECKDGRIRLTLSVDNIDKITTGFSAGEKYYPGSTTTVFVPDLFDLYARKVEVKDNDLSKDNIIALAEMEEGLFAGYELYYTIKHMLYIADTLDNYLNKKSVIDSDDNW